MPITISKEEKDLLDAAKAVCKVFGYANGHIVTLASKQEEGTPLLIEMIDKGSIVVDGNVRVQDLP